MGTTMAARLLVEKCTPGRVLCSFGQGGPNADGRPCLIHASPSDDFELGL